MLPGARSPAELHKQRTKVPPQIAAAQSLSPTHTRRNQLTTSYNALLEEFSSKELHTVGNYALSHLIGKGSFGKVYLASHKLINGTRIVLKSAKKDDQNLAREIHHHRQFLHPHIARLYEVIVTESHVWLVLEYCPGDELYNYLIKNGPLEPALVQKIFAQLVGAVSYVHSKQCVHRDLKLENILLDKSGNVKLCDFGFTREYEGKSNYLQTWCGTVCYSAPEMIKGEKYAGEKVDVWSLGIILYALLTGELPFDEGDDEAATKQKILKDEPLYPPSMAQGARDLIVLMLSKRPLLRPSLSDLLTNPWLGEHTPQQQAILKLQQPAPFTTPLEKDTLQRMRSAGVDIDMVIENVLSQRCDSLAGWWGLLLEKEERKAKRRERKRKEKDAETKVMRRISAASARLDRLAPTIMESAEEGQSSLNLPDTIARGREPVRQADRPSSIVTTPVNEDKVGPMAGSAPTSPPQPPPKERALRSASASRRRSQLGAPRPSAARRNSTLHLVTTNPRLLVPESKQQKRKHQSPFINQLVSFKHWIRDSARRTKSPHDRPNDNHLRPDILPSSGPNKLRRAAPSPLSGGATDFEGRGQASPRHPNTVRPRITTATSATSSRRMSHSPSPLTPSSSYRRASGLRGRKSTSSSVSSVRSLHGHSHHASHSKASSASSNSLISPPASAKSLSTYGGGSSYRRASPHAPVKVLPGTPTTSTFPSGIRVVRGPPPALNLSNGASSTQPAVASASNPHLTLQPSPFGSFAPPSPGLVFQKRRRSPFKGPMLGQSIAGAASAARRKSEGGSETRSDSGKAKIQVVEEEDEDEYEEIPDEGFVTEDDALTAGVDARLGELAKQQALGHDVEGDVNGGSRAMATSEPATPLDENMALVSTGPSTPLRKIPGADTDTLKALEKAK